MSEKFTPGQMTTPAYRWFNSGGVLCRYDANNPTDNGSYYDQEFEAFVDDESTLEGQLALIEMKHELAGDELSESTARELFPEAF